MTTRQRAILFLVLIILMGIGVTACTLPFTTSTASDTFSVDAWKKTTGYKGDVCILPSVEEGSNEGVKAECTNHIKPTQANLEAYERYLLWYSCKKYASMYACVSLKE